MFQPFQAPNYAGFWLRFAASFIDSVITTAVLCPVGLLLGAAGGLADNGKQGAATLGAQILSWLIGLAVGWLYNALCESSSWQGTVGKKVLGIRVTDEYGRRISFARATGRHFAKNLSALVCFVGFIMAAFTEKKQALHDMLAGTLVLEGPPAAGFGPTLDQPPPPPPSSFGYGSGL
jgi:uncharacterized RDD family membrane protein YckC